MQYVALKTELFPKPVLCSPAFFFNSASGEEVGKGVNIDFPESSTVQLYSQKIYIFMRNKKITPALQWREQIPQCRSSLAQDTPSPLATSHFLNAIHSVQRGAQVVMSLGFPPVLLTLQDTGETVHLDF